MSTTTTSPVLPVIEISPAPPEEPQPEPYSPFTPLFPGCGRVMDDTYRPSLLTPPVQSWSLSPLRPLSERRPRLTGQGLKDEQFQALLRASKERSAVAASKKQHDLRKEVALKAHKNKQLERRALFLSKIGAPPSPTATSLPKTPPDSPAIFHYSLPSPGLCSPLALFEKLGLDDQDSEERGVRKVWVEQVDFRLPKQQKKQPRPVLDDVPEVPTPVRVKTPSITLTTPEEEHDQPRAPQQRGHARKRSIPSLEQITERYSAQVDTAAPTPTRPRAPLPAFLNARRQSPSPPLPTELPMVTVTAPAEPPRPRLACTGRIRFPSRSPSPPSDSDSSAVATSKPLPALPSEAEIPQRRMHALPPTPLTPPCLPALEIRTMHVPRTESTSPVHSRLTEANLHALNSRTSTAREMLSTIRRRTTVISYGNGRMQMYPPAPSTPPPTWRSAWQVEDEKQRRRHSAPADLPKTGRVGFMHPVLALPGGF
ncbi:hypothetical protein ACEPAH_1191 [Sanghuangporus vaninii]